MTPFFLDTGYLIALESSDDQHHLDAATHWAGLRDEPVPLVTTSYVLDEVVTFFNVRHRHAKAVEIGELLLRTGAIRLIHVDKDLLLEAWRYFARHTDKRYSLTDCVSFIVMKRLKLKVALTFDRHFSQAGFQPQP